MIQWDEVQCTLLYNQRVQHIHPVPSPGGKSKGLREGSWDHREWKEHLDIIQSPKRWCEVSRALAKYARSTWLVGEEATVV